MKIMNQKYMNIFQQKKIINTFVLIHKWKSPEIDKITNFWLHPQIN